MDVVFFFSAKNRAINPSSFQGISYANQVPPHFFVEKHFMGYKKAVFSLVNNFDLRELNI